MAAIRLAMLPECGQCRYEGSGPRPVEGRARYPDHAASKIERLQDTSHPRESEAASASADARNWNRIYALVLAHLAFWILGLWAVTRFLGQAS